MEDIEPQVRAKKVIDQASENMLRFDREYEAMRRSLFRKFILWLIVLVIVISAAARSIWGIIWM